MKKIVIILDSQEGHITHVFTCDPDLDVSVVDIDTASLDPVKGPYDPQVTYVVADVDDAANAHIREKVPGYVPEEEDSERKGSSSEGQEGEPDQSSQETFLFDSNARGRDEKLATKIFEWNDERLSYSSLFDARDPDGEEQTDCEGLIAAHLFDEYEKFDLLGHTRWIIAFVVESFFQDALSRPVEDLLQLMETLPEYLAAWQHQLAKRNDGPNEEEAATAGRDTLLLTLRFLCPEWVKIDSDC